jgi:hypothetical protein
MALKAPKGAPKGNFIPQANIEPGTYPARLVQILELGLQPQKAYQGKEKPPAIELMLTYELVDTFMKDAGGSDIEDKPRWISETLPFYGLEADKAKSTQRYLAFDPQQDYEGDFAQLIGKPINVTVVNNAVGDKVYDNIATISAMRPKDADKCPPLVNPTKLLDLDTPDMEVFNSLPEWVREKIKGNLKFQGSALQKMLGNTPPKKADKSTPAPTPADNKAEVDNNPY